MNIYIEPHFRGKDSGEGGIRRVVEAQQKWLPEFGFNVVDQVSIADVVATHAGNMVEVPVDVPWVCHTHGLYWAEYDWPDWCQRLNRDVIEAMRRADHVTAPSEWVAQALRRGMWLRPSILHHGVDPEEWEGGTPGDYVLWNKNRTDPVCDSTVVSELAERAPGTRFVTTFGIKLPNITVIGRVGFDEGKEWVKNAGIYLATTRETFGIGTLEAMAAGVPVVGWAWGGQREIIRHGETGWLSEPGNYSDLLRGIQWAFANRSAIASAARADIESRWTWRVAMSRYADLYMRLIEETSEPSPKVSVVVPCYNLAQYLPDAIKSLQSQTMADWEAIIVDDASPDNTERVALELCQDERVKYVKNERNLYLAGALNVGISHASGRYILPLDADNMIDSNALELLSGALDGDRGIHIAYGACRFVLEDGQHPDTGVSPNGVSEWPGEFSFRAQMLHRNQIPSTCMYRREVWSRTGGYRTRCRTAEDAEFWTRASSLGFVPKKVTGATTLVYRQRPDSMSRVEADWDWTAWFPWSRKMALVPFGAAVEPPAAIGFCWPVECHEKPPVSVIIPVGPGHEACLIDALDSLEAQEFRNWEAIVVNDTGHPLDVPHSWAKVIDTGGGSGPAAARNVGINAASGSAIVPLDADDYLQPNALLAFHHYWLAEDRKAVIYSQWWDDKGETIELYDPEDYNAADLITKGCIHAVTAMYPRAALDLVGGFDEAMANWEDWDLQIALASKGVCGLKLPMPLWTYRKATGKRRDENYGEFERGKDAILAKWSRFWDGKEELMACRGCSGRTSIPVHPQSRPLDSSKPSIPEGSAILLEYQLEGASRTFRGPATRTEYRFGADPGHRRKYVLSADAPYLLSLAGMFKALDVPASVEPATAIDGGPALLVVGPPIREEVKVDPEVPPQDTHPMAGQPTAVGDGPIHIAIASEDKVPSINQLRRILPDLDKARVAELLAKEKADAKRVTAIALLERALALSVNG